MRKFLSAVLIALVVVLSAHCSANRYDNDPNWYFFMSFHCWNCYLYLPSVDVQEYNPPHYQIAGRYANIGYRHNEGKSGEYTKTIRYNWYTKEAFTYENGQWRKMCQDKIGTTFYGVDRLTANALFRAAYGMNFYN